MTPNCQQNQQSLRWQSQLILLLFLPVATAWVTLQAGQAWYFHDAVLLQASAISLGFAVLVFALRAATAGAALTGALIAVILYLWIPGWRTALWPLLALFLLTFAATRFGRRHKERLGTAEGKRGRTASQVVANLGVAAMAAIPLSATRVFTPSSTVERSSLVVMVAALAEATADTLSSELGQVLGGEPRMLTTFGRVPVGTDGAVSVAGTVAGCFGAGVLVFVAALVLRLNLQESLVALGCGVFGLFADSLLGATMERWNWLNNDAVNTLSTLAAALAAAFLSRLLAF